MQKVTQGIQSKTMPVLFFACHVKSRCEVAASEMLERPQDAKKKADLDAAFCSLRGNTAWQVVFGWLIDERARLDKLNHRAKGRLLKHQQGACQTIDALEGHYQDTVKARKP